MINLLPDQQKIEIKAARTNVILARYSTIIGLAVLFILGVLYISHFVLNETKQSALAIIESNDLKAGVYSDTKEQVDTLSSGLAQTKVILDQEVLYSKALLKLSSEMPPGTVLEKITLDQSAFSGAPISAKVFAKTTEQAVALQEKFRSSTLFSNVSFQSIDQNNGVAGYPVSVNMSFTLNKSEVK